MRVETSKAIPLPRLFFASDISARTGVTADRAGGLGNCTPLTVQFLVEVRQGNDALLIPVELVHGGPCHPMHTVPLGPVDKESFDTVPDGELPTLVRKEPNAVKSRVLDVPGLHMSMLACGVDDAISEVDTAATVGPEPATVPGLNIDWDVLVALCPVDPPGLNDPPHRAAVSETVVVTVTCIVVMKVVVAVTAAVDGLMIGLVGSIVVDVASSLVGVSVGRVSPGAASDSAALSVSEDHHHPLPPGSNADVFHVVVVVVVVVVVDATASVWGSNEPELARAVDSMATKGTVTVVPSTSSPNTSMVAS